MTQDTDRSVASTVAMLCQGTEVYGIGTIQRLYATGLPGILFVCFERGPLWDWLSQNGMRRKHVQGLATLSMSRSSLSGLSRLATVLPRVRSTARTLSPILRDEGIRIVHTHWLPQQIVAGFLRRGHGFKTVWQINNNTNPKRLMGLGVRLNHAMARWGADLLLPASRYIANNWLASGVRTHVIHNAAEPRFAEPNALDAPPIRCVIAGRLEESKGHHLAVEAVLAARREGLSITLDIFGGPLDDNPYAAGLKQRIAAENAESFVSFMGFRSDLRDLHQNYHLGLQCRIDPEPCSLWVCETLVDGLPLVASASGGTPELVDDGVTGLLFEPGNQSAITEKVIALCRNPARLAQWRRAAFERGAAHFRSSRMMSESVDCYRSLLR